MVYTLRYPRVQIITGIFLVMFYTPNVSLLFLVWSIYARCPYGWLLRYLHANGASFFFIVVYLHLIRGLFYGSFQYPRRLLWCSGVIILLLMIITAFLGYVLPWGQMSYRAATVITNLASTVPVFGQKIVIWLWSAFAVDNPTLNKFFSLHYILPFVILAMVLLHLALLHQAGSSTPAGFSRIHDKIPFHPYYIVKDLLSVIVLVSLIIFFVSFAPNTLGHPDNYIPANPDQTPEHIVPEWYFLPFYAILRSIPNKLLGVIALVASIGALLILPFIDRPLMRSSIYKPFTMILNVLFIANCFVLGYIGQSPLEEPFLTLGRLSTKLYFGYFILYALVSTFDGFMLRLVRKVGENKAIKSPFYALPLAVISDNSFPLLKQVDTLVSIEFMLVPTVFFALMYIFILLIDSDNSIRIPAIGTGLLALICLYYPLFSFVLTFIYSTFILFLTYPHAFYKGFLEKQQTFTRNLLHVLHKKEILHFFMAVNIKTFCQPKKVLIQQAVLIFIVGTANIVASRYYFIVTLSSKDTSYTTLALLYPILYIGIFFIYLRTIINISLILMPLVQRYDIMLLSPQVYYIVTGEEHPSSTSATPGTSGSGPTPPNRSTFSLISITTNRYRNFFADGTPRFFRGSTLLITIIGSCGALGATYYARNHYLQTVEQTKQITRQTDIAAVSAGLISTEEYQRRHPGDKP